MKNIKSPNFFDLGYAHYPKKEDPTEALKSCENEDKYMQAFNKWTSGYNQAYADDNRLESNHYDDAKP
jgi:hypothetical protein